MLPITVSSLLSGMGQYTHKYDMKKRCTDVQPQNAVYLCSKTDSSWRGQTTSVSTVLNQSYPAGGESNKRNVFHQCRQTHSCGILNSQSRPCLLTNFFVEPSSDHHGTIGVPFGSLTSFPKCLHFSTTFLLQSKWYFYYTIVWCEE